MEEGQGLTAPVEVLDATRDLLGESPLWSVEEQALYRVDIEGRAIRRHDWRTRTTRAWRVPERIGCIALHARGGLVAALASGIVHARLGDGPDADCTMLASAVDPQGTAGTRRYNDGRCDREGRFWVTRMAIDPSGGEPSGTLHRLDVDGLSAPLVDGLVIGNGLGFAPDGRTMYLSDSHASAQRVWAFDLAHDGTPSNRRPFVDMAALAGRPDGAAVDVDGGYWIAANDGGCVHRFAPDGRLDRSIAVPVPKPSMCAFGGPDLDRLFVTSIRRPGATHALDGAVFVLDPGTRGIAEHPWVG